MRSYWSETRANGEPKEPGTFVWVQDLEDGTHPIYVYGRSEKEIFEKLDRQNMHAQAALARRSQANGNGSAPNPPAPPAPRVTADQVMQATADLDNPAKAGDAVTTLVESATGINLRKMAWQEFGRMAEKWQADTPDFYPHKGNIELVTGYAKARTGGNPAAITPQVLTDVFNELRAKGSLFEEPAERTDEPPAPNAPLPGESPVQRTERPRRATGTRSTSFSAPSTTAHTRTLKYTEEQIRTMPLAKSRELVNSNDPDYLAATEFYFGQQATA